MSFFEELKRRNIFKVGVAYIVGAWLLLQSPRGRFSHPTWMSRSEL